MQYVLTLFVIAITSAVFGCKPPAVGSDINAIVSADGKQAFGLIPMRNYAPPLGDDYSFEDSRRIANALRTVFAAVECNGDTAAMQMNILEGMSRQNAESVRRDRDSIILMDEIGSLSFSCKVIGSHTLSIGSFTKIFSDAPKDQETFEIQQAVWLAARGRTDAAAKGEFSAAFYDFLYEGLGAFPAKDKATFEAAITRLDERFNPCVGGSGEFNKRKVYTCDGNKNYMVGNSVYQPILKRFLSTVSTVEQATLQAIEKLDTKGELEGFETAILVRSNIADMNIKAVRKTASEDDAENPPAESDTEISPLIRALASKLGAIEDTFGIRLGSKPGEVYSISNPMMTNQPPAGDDGLGLTGFELAGTATTAPKAATTTNNTWQRTGNNTFQRPIGNGQYETSIATKNANGGYNYTNSTWSQQGSGWSRQNTYPHGAGVQRSNISTAPVQNQQAARVATPNNQPLPGQYNSPNMGNYQQQNAANLGKDPYTWQRTGDGTTFQRQLQNGRWETAAAYKQSGQWQYNKATWESSNGEWQKMNFDDKNIGKAVTSNPFGQRSQGDVYNKDNNQCGDMARNSAQFMQRNYGGETKMIHYKQANSDGKDQINHAMTAWRPNGNSNWVVFDAQTQQYRQVPNLEGSEAKGAVADMSARYHGTGGLQYYQTTSARTAYGRSNNIAQTGWNSPIRQKVLGGYWMNDEAK